MGYVNYLISKQKGPNKLPYVGGIDEAIKWLTVAADNGKTEAQYTLSLIYYKGEYGETRVTSVTALAWFYKAAQYGNVEALAAVKTTQQQMTSDQITEAKEKTN